MSYPLVLRLRRRRAAAAHGCRTRDDLSVWTVSGRRRQGRHAGPAERARVERVLREGAAAAASSPPSRASLPTSSATPRATSCTPSSSKRSRSSRAEQVVARLDEAQIANARVNDMHEVWSHEQLKARERWTQVDTPAGRIPALLPPGLPEGFTPRMDPVPALGEHTEAILSRTRLRRRRDRETARGAGASDRWTHTRRMTPCNYQQILYNVKDRIATITLNRPEQLNAWTDVMSEEVWQATHAADADENVRVIVLTGSGRAFCAGGDITGFKSENPRQLIDKLPRAYDFSRRPDFQSRAAYFPVALEARHRDVERRDRGHRAGSRVVLRSAFRSGRGGDHDGVLAHRARIRIRHGLDAQSRGRVTRNAFDLLLSARKVKGAGGAASGAREQRSSAGQAGRSDLRLCARSGGQRFAALAARDEAPALGHCRFRRCTKP